MNHVKDLAARVLDQISHTDLSAVGDYGQFSRLVDETAEKDKQSHPHLYADLVGDIRQRVYVLALSRGVLPSCMARKVHIHASELAFQSTEWLRPDYLCFPDGTQIGELELFLDFHYIQNCMAVAENAEFIRELFLSCGRVRKFSIVSWKWTDSEFANMEYMAARLIPLALKCIATDEVSIGCYAASEETVRLVEATLSPVYWSEAPYCRTRARVLSFPWLEAGASRNCTPALDVASELAPRLCRAVHRNEHGGSALSLAKRCYTRSFKKN